MVSVRQGGLVRELNRSSENPRDSPTKGKPYDHFEARSHDLQTEAGCPVLNASSKGPQGTDDDPCLSHYDDGALTKGTNASSYRARERSTMDDPNSMKYESPTFRLSR